MALHSYPLALLVVSGGTALAIIFLMASVTFLDSPKHLLFNFIPSAVHEYFPVNPTVRDKFDYFPQAANNASSISFNHLFNDSTTRPPLAAAAFAPTRTDAAMFFNDSTTLPSTTMQQPNSTITVLRTSESQAPKAERQKDPGALVSLLYADNEIEFTDEGLNEINSHQHPQDSPLTDHLDSVSVELLGLTLARLNLRARRRLARAGAHLAATSDLLAEYQASNRSAPLLACNFESQGGLGNWMFMIASAFGLARSTHRIPVVLHDYSWADRHFANFSLQRMNRSTFTGSNESQPWNDAMRHETGAGKYRADLANFTMDKNLVVNGYLQSWKYFDASRDDIRSLFTFSEEVYNRSLSNIETLLQSYWNSTRERVRLPALVGIHVRRGDITTDHQIKYGYIPATEEYLLRAAVRFQQDFDPVTFIVVSNDIAYCRQLFAGLDNFIFSENTGLEVDMATMGLMDHLILSVGTYSWWAGYLSDAKTIMYFKDWPRNGSEMRGMYTDEDFYYPAWTPYK